MVKAYKVTDKDMKCRGYQFEVGEEYTYDGDIKLCESGFHFCRKLVNCFNYYAFDPLNRILEIEIIGDIEGNPEDKEVTNNFKVIKEITWGECLDLVNVGVGNSGNRNSGNRNSGDRNSGYLNSGDRNSGDWNSGNSNSGYWNSGDRNSGDRNSGYYNSGDRNSGDWNSGDWNSGDWNLGDWNLGNSNSGDYNSGDRNSGDWNSGYWNSGDRNSGYLNSTKSDKIRVFNKWIDEEVDLYFPKFMQFSTTLWIDEDSCSEEEKLKYKASLDCMHGYLKTYTYKDAFLKSWKKADKKDRIKVKDIPGFDKNIFLEISGIDVDID